MTQERTEITNKYNVQAEMTLTTVDQSALAIVDPTALRQQKEYSGPRTTINKQNA